VRFAEALLAWFDENRLDRPWRDRSDPYEIWVSEVMLQQTRSETVGRFYERFLERFPTVEALAVAPVEDVLAAWSGLGYYRRARQLHQAARLVHEGGGKLPTTVEELLELPGIGPYTAAAIASIAFCQPTPVLDGNVERVLSRVEAMRENPRAASGRRRLLAWAGDAIDPLRPGDFNQALMELGSTICTPRNPACPACPLLSECAAAREGSPEMYPRLPKRSKPTLEKRLAVVVRNDGRILMSRRADDARQLAGVWELPWIVCSDDDPVSALEERYGGSWELKPVGRTVRHSITSRQLEVSVATGDWHPPEFDSIAEAEHLGWLEERSLDNVPTTSLVGKALAVLADS
jgi:A/G-specific adenine glycosylase